MGLFKKKIHESAGQPIDIVYKLMAGSGGQFYGVSKALSNSAFWCCLMNLCRTVASLPVHQYQNTGKGRILMRSSPGAILLGEPCVYMTAWQWRFVMAFNYELYGVAYAKLDMSQTGHVLNMYPISPTSITSRWKDGRLGYVYNPTGEWIPYEQMLVIHNTPTGWKEHAMPLTYAENDLDVSTSSKELQTNYYKKGTTIGGVVTVPKNTEKAAKDAIKASFQGEYAGSANAYRTIVLEEGIKYEPIRLTENDSSKLSQAQEWTVLEVCRRFGCPPFFAGDLTKATYANSEQQGTQLVQNCIQPRIISWEAALDRVLSTKDGEYIKFKLDGLMRGDSAARASFYTQMIQNGTMSINECRELEDQDPVPNGDAHFFPMNFQTLEKAVKYQPSSSGFESRKPEQSLTERQLRDKLFGEAFMEATKSGRAQIERMIRRQLKQEIDLLKQMVADGKTADAIVTEFKQASKKVANDLGQEYVAIFQSIMAKMVPATQRAVATGEEVPEDKYNAYAAKYALAASDRHANFRAVDTEKALSGVESDKLGTAVSDLADHWVDVVPADESEEESKRSGNAFSVFLFAALGVTYMHVVASGDACEFCRSIDGRVVEVNGTVLAKGSSVEDGEGNVRVISKSLKHPPWHTHCGCYVAPGK